jgi:adenylate cyclase
MENMAYPLPDKPSLAVLPFGNMSDDSELEYLSDGFTDTIIGGLSRISSIFVMSRTSTFAYKKKPVTIKQVAEELGVHYVIEGSIQKSGDQLRITVQMIDALTGYHVWSESYDRNIKDIFKIQDEITLNIAKSIGIKIESLSSAIPSGHNVAGTDNLDAYLKILSAYHYYHKRSPEGLLKAKELCEQAIAMDPNYLIAYIFLSDVSVQAARGSISKFPEKSLEQALKMAQKAVDLDESDSYAHSSLARVLYNIREHDKAIAEFEQALALNPENGEAYLFFGWTLNWAGRPQEAVPYFKKLMRLIPRLRHSGLLGIAAANILMQKYEDAISHLQEGIELAPTWFRLHLDLAACYAALDQEEEAKTESQEVLRLHPKFSLKKFITKLPAKDPEFIKPYVEALQKTGLPE